MWQTGKQGTDATQSGPISSAVNLGTGLGVYKNTTAGVLNFRTLIEGTGIAFTDDGNEITITATGATDSWIDGGNTLTALGVLGTLNLWPMSIVTNSVERIRIATTGEITFNQAYSFPTADGTPNQLLTTDGNGQLQFVNTAFVSQTSAAAHNAGDWIRIGSMNNLDYANLLISSFTVTNTGGIQSFSISSPRNVNSEVNIYLNESIGAPRISAMRLVNVLTTVYVEVLIDAGSPATFLSVSLILDRPEGSFDFVTPFVVSPNGTVLFTNVFGIDALMSINSSARTGADFLLTKNNRLSLLNYTFPLADGTADQVMTTDGAGVLSFVTRYGVRVSTTSAEFTAGTWVKLGSMPAYGTAEIDVRVNSTSAPGTGSYRIKVGSFNSVVSNDCFIDVETNCSVALIQGVKFVTEGTGVKLLVQVANGGTSFQSVLTGESVINSFVISSPATATDGTGTDVYIVTLDAADRVSCSHQRIGTYFKVDTGKVITIGADLNTAVSINGLFKLPKVDGTAKQGMTTDGLGVVSWTDMALGAINLGTGTGIYTSLDTNKLIQLKSLKAGTGLIWTNDTTSATISFNEQQTWGIPIVVNNPGGNSYTVGAALAGITRAQVYINLSYAGGTAEVYPTAGAVATNSRSTYFYSDFVTSPYTALPVNVNSGFFSFNDQNANEKFVIMDVEIYSGKFYAKYRTQEFNFNDSNWYLRDGATQTSTSVPGDLSQLTFKTTNNWSSCRFTIIPFHF